MPSITTPDPCACCNAAGTAKLECRNKGGVATIQGYTEFTSPSTPPKKYRKKTLSGSIITCEMTSTDGSCPDPTAGGISTGTVTWVSGARSATIALVSAAFVDVHDGQQWWNLTYNLSLLFDDGPGCPTSMAVSGPGGDIYVGGGWVWFEYGNCVVHTTTLTRTLLAGFPLAGTTVQIGAHVAANDGHYADIVVAPYVALAGTEKKYSGSCDIDDAGAETVSAQVEDIDLGRSCSSGSGGTATPTCSAVAAETYLEAPVIGPTTKTQAASAGCHTSGTGHDVRVLGSRAETLTNEDTEEDAIARLMSGQDWSPWGLTAGCANCCCAGRSQRTTGFTVSITESQFRITVHGSFPGQLFDLTYKFSRGPYGGTVVPYQTILRTVSIGDDLKGTIEDDLPNVVGYTTCIQEAPVVGPYTGGGG